MAAPPRRSARSILLTYLCLFTMLIAACSTDSTDTTDSDPTSPAQDYRLGDTGPAGGTIVYAGSPFACGVNLDETCTILEIAPPSSQVLRPWSPPVSANTPIAGADGRDLGSGEANTASVSSLLPDPETSAAAYAASYELNGFDDWFLPSIGELELVYANRTFVEGFLQEMYWSSTEIGSSGAWAQYFFAGTVLNVDAKQTSMYTRPLRAQ